MAPRSGPAYLALVGALGCAHRLGLDQQQQEERQQEASSRYSHQDAAHELRSSPEEPRFLAPPLIPTPPQTALPTPSPVHSLPSLQPRINLTPPCCLSPRDTFNTP